MIAVVTARLKAGQRRKDHTWGLTKNTFIQRNEEDILMQESNYNYTQWGRRKTGWILQAHTDQPDQVRWVTLLLSGCCRDRSAQGGPSHTQTFICTHVQYTLQSKPLPRVVLCGYTTYEQSPRGDASGKLHILSQISLKDTCLQVSFLLVLISPSILIIL